MEVRELPLSSKVAARWPFRSEEPVMARFSRVACLALVVLFAASWSFAEPRQSKETAPSRITQLWNQLLALWGESGCGMDPYGGSCRESSTSTLDSGCIMDPDGRCRDSNSATTRDSGCGMDPDGSCGQ